MDTADRLASPAFPTGPAGWPARAPTRPSIGSAPPSIGKSPDAGASAASPGRACCSRCARRPPPRTARPGRVSASWLGEQGEQRSFGLRGLADPRSSAFRPGPATSGRAGPRRTEGRPSFAAPPHGGCACAWRAPRPARRRPDPDRRPHQRRRATRRLMQQHGSTPSPHAAAGQPLRLPRRLGRACLARAESAPPRRRRHAHLPHGPAPRESADSAGSASPVEGVVPASRRPWPPR